MTGIPPANLVNSWSAFDIDPDIITFFQIGIVAGICVTTGLSFFPGKPSNCPPDDTSDQSNESQEPVSWLKQNDDISFRDMNDSKDLVTIKRMMTRRLQGEGSWTPHQQMNFGVYVMMLCIAFVTLICVYDDERSFLLAWIVHHFPRELSALGLPS